MTEYEKVGHHNAGLEELDRAIAGMSVSPPRKVRGDDSERKNAREDGLYEVKPSKSDRLYTKHVPGRKLRRDTCMVTEKIAERMWAHVVYGDTCVRTEI